MRLSNDRPFDLFAVFPHCLDNEYWPEEDISNSLRSDLSARDKRALEKRRSEAVEREFIRSLVYSPQVFLGRQSATSSEPLVKALETHPDAFGRLMAEGRIVLLLMEDSFDAFIRHPPFPVNAEGRRLWRDFLTAHGEGAVCSLRLTDELQKEVQRRYATFFRDLCDEDEAGLAVLFAECSGRAGTAAIPDNLHEEFKDFCALVKDDLRAWVSGVSWKDFRRTNVYERHVWLNQPHSDPKVQQRRTRHRLTIKRMADVAYNHNTPVALGRQSFTPPGTPDPTSLPSHLYKPMRLPDADAARRSAAGQGALSELLEQRAQAQQHFFYRMQEDMILPDVGSFTVADVCEIHQWSEWKYFNAAQDAAMRFVDAADLYTRLEALFDANVKLHDRLGQEMKRRAWWRAAVHGAVDLGLAVTACMGCEALLPSHAMQGLPPMLAAVVGGVAHTSIEAGIDLCIVGVEKATQHVVKTIGGRQTVCRQLKLTSADLERLDRLKAAEADAGALAVQDRVLRESDELAKEA